MSGFGRKGLGFRRLAPDRGASTTLEFALVGPLLLLITLITLQMGFLLMQQWSLDNGVRYAAREIQIGDIWAGGQNPSATFVSDVCGSCPFPLPSCSGSRQVYVTYGNSFGALTPASTMGGFLHPQGFSAPVGNVDVLIQVGYPVPYLSNWLSVIAGASGSLMLSSVAVRTENYTE